MKSKSEILSDELIHSLGILDWNVTSHKKPVSYDHFSAWVKRDAHQPLHYLADERAQKRASLANVFPEHQSAFVFLFSYAHVSKFLQEFYQSEESNGLKIASYVMGYEGMDYHIVLLEKLKQIQQELQAKFPQAKFQHTLDIQPVLERDLAYQAGLGWFGKNSMLIHRQYGSFFIIGSLLSDIPLPALAEPVVETDHCGNCTECIDLCPTDAIDPVTRTLIGNKCISTYTIEVFHPDRMEPPTKMEHAQGEIYGCDICQDVCPWNKKYLKQLEAKSLSEVIPSDQREVFEFFLSRPMEQLYAEVSGMSNKQFEKRFKRTPLARTRRTGVLKNIEFWLKLSSGPLKTS